LKGLPTGEGETEFQEILAAIIRIMIDTEFPG
jgi:hypothetical protein